MSGFAGVMNTAEGVHAARRMGRVLDARGPAARHEVVVDGAAFVVTQSGTGGVPVAAVDGWTVAIEGQVLNAAALAREMAYDPAEGPAATVARLLAQVGVERTLARLAGPAAVAGWHAATKRGFVCRDRIGERQVYLSQNKGVLAFASEARALAQGGIAGEVDGAAVRRFVASSAVLPPCCWRRGARALAPASWVDCGGDGQDRRGWTLPVHAPGGGGNRERWVKSVRYALDHAFSARARVAGDYALAVSGGLGSAALLANLPAHDRPAVVLVTDDPGEAAARASGLPVKRVELRVDLALDEVVLDAPVASEGGLFFLGLARAAWEAGLSGLALGAGHRYAFDPPRPGPLARVDRFLRPQGALARLLDELGPPLPGDAEAGLLAEWEALAASAPVDDPALAAHWLAGRSLLPEVELRDAVSACAAYGLEALLPLADAGVVQVAAQVPCDVHHARARRSLLAELGDTSPRFPSAPRLSPPWPPDIEERLAPWVAPDHVRAVLANPALAGRAHRLGALAQWLGVPTGQG